MLATRSPSFQRVVADVMIRSMLIFLMALAMLSAATSRNPCATVVSVWGAGFSADLFGESWNAVVVASRSRGCCPSVPNTEEELWAEFAEDHIAVGNASGPM